MSQSTPLEDRRPPRQERPLLTMSVRPILTYVYCMPS
jgi:hypothetical protein